MPQWLNLPSTQKSYGVHTDAMGPCHPHLGIPDPLAVVLLPATETLQVVFAGRGAHDGLPVLIAR